MEASKRNVVNSQIFKKAEIKNYTFKFDGLTVDNEVRQLLREDDFLAFAFLIARGRRIRG